MASLAGGGEARGNVIRIRCCHVKRFVTAVAIRRGGSEVVVDVAVRAGNTDVRARQGENGFVVVECGRLPGRSVVANLAGLRESRSHMIRIRGPIEVFNVT